MTRTLTLRRESLADLTRDELAGVAGGAAITVQGLTCRLEDCLVESDFGQCYSWLC
ncbi:MAG TPA: hypothetical protein VGX28_12575 [Frankiaceae bacterium]|nr:hypothetical protein [Frankiaceae bacterium]